MRILHDLSKCVGCGYCASALPEKIELAEGKARVKGAKYVDGKAEFEVKDWLVGCPFGAFKKLD